jgi:UPF0716 protein FxsA
MLTRPGPNGVPAVHSLRRIRHMFVRLLVLFLFVPLIELALLIRLGQWIGLLGTLAIVAGTAVLGAALARRHGVRAWTAIRDELRAGRVPASALADGLLILIGGIVLLTPGLLTDALGFALLLPPTRNALKRSLRRRFEEAVRRGEAGVSVLLLR